MNKGLAVQASSMNDHPNGTSLMIRIFKWGDVERYLFGRNSMSESVEKRSFDGMNFKFMAAYNQYSENFDGAENDRQLELNDLITKLYLNEINYDAFYAAMATEDSDRYEFHRTKISTSRKFAYRKNERKVDRIKRHK